MTEQDGVPADLPCVEVVGLITDYLEEALPAAERHRLDEHLAECDGCAAVLDQFRTTIEMTGHLAPDNVDRLDEPTRTDLLGAFRRWAADRPLG